MYVRNTILLNLSLVGTFKSLIHHITSIIVSL